MRAETSIIPAFDGPAKCGKTTIIGQVAKRAYLHDSVIAAAPHEDESLGDTNGAYVPPSSVSFGDIYTVSAGDMFRAATLYVIAERGRRDISRFGHDEATGIRELLAKHGMHEALQKDPEVESMVSTVAQMEGAHKVCSALFCDQIVEAYYADGGGNLVIVDARNPVEHMQHNGILGNAEGRIRPTSILPIYIDTPVDVAARRMGGDFTAQKAKIAKRRSDDSERREFPVRPPETLMHHFGEWMEQFDDPLSGDQVAVPFRLDNGRNTTLEHIGDIADVVSAVARRVAARAHCVSIKTGASIKQASSGRIC